MFICGGLQACKQKEDLLRLLEASVSYKTMVPDEVFVAICSILDSRVSCSVELSLWRDAGMQTEGGLASAVRS